MRYKKIVYLFHQSDLILISSKQIDLKIIAMHKRGRLSKQSVMYIR